MPEGYDGTKPKKQQGSPGLQAVGGVHNIIIGQYLVEYN
jgi:hypothetical protein